MTGQFLSEIVNLEDFEYSCLNIVDAPCGSGKTTFAKNILPKIKPCSPWGEKDMLYLIDTKNGKEQILKSEGFEFGINPWTGEDEWKINGIKVMTYASYALLCKMAPKKEQWQEDSLILCDELHQAVSWSKWKGEDNLHKLAINLIHERINVGNNIVVAISATTKLIHREFGRNKKDIQLYGEPRHYEENKVVKYNDLSLLLRSIDTSKRGIIFVPQITQILKYKQILDKRGIRTEAIWSINNEEYPLSKEQLDVRDYIIKNKHIPEKIDVLFINKSSETSISFGLKNQSSSIDYMIIHSTEKDTQIQVRGRYRKDLNTLYLHDDLARKVVVLDEKWLNRELNKTDKKMLCNELDFRDNGRKLGWTTIKRILSGSGYVVQDIHTNKERFSVINRDKNVEFS